MKHRIIIILSLLTMGFIPSLAEDNYWGVALLSHQGKQTAFAADNVQAAVDAAVEGDTIHLTAGHYKDITLNKKVYLQMENWDWAINVYLELPGNAALESSLFMGYGFHVKVRCNLQSIYLTGFYGNLSTENQYRIESVTFDRCEISEINYEYFNVGKLQANNCNIGSLWNGTSTTTESKFLNCNFDTYQYSVSGATFENCMLRNWGDPVTIDNCKFTNCVFNNETDNEKFLFGGNTELSYCYNMTEADWNTSKEYLEENNYLGTDNTVVGFYGGATPFEGIIPEDTPQIWGNDLEMKGKSVVGNWWINPTR